MITEKSPLQKVSRILKFLGWLQLIIFTLSGIAILYPQYVMNKPDRLLATLIFLLIETLPFINFFLSKAIKNNQKWSKNICIIYSILILIGFPIGTIIGIYILWQLLNKHKSTIKLQ
ncbi:MAG: hypothetical protein V4525_12660 [Pseudomonadota bacterium]